jgi:predicted nucleic acid-binding protein
LIKLDDYKDKIDELKQQGYSNNDILSIVKRIHYSKNKMDRQKLKKALLKDFWLFVRYVDVRKNGKSLVPDEPLYKEFCDKLSRLDKYTLILLPRRHLKTLIVSLFLIWYILNFVDNAVTLVCETRDKAKALMRGIRSIMINNERFKEVFGIDLLARTDNDKYKLTLKHRVSTAKEVNIQAFSIEQPLQSIRADLMLWEDVIGMKFIDSEATRDHVFKSWEHSDSILESGSKIIVTGTRYTAKDLYNFILEENKKTNEWNTTIYGIYKEDGSVLCPYVMSEEEVQKKKLKHTPQFFAAQYENRVIAEENQVFKVDEYLRYDILNLDDINYIVIGVDLSLGKGGDKNAIAIMGVGKNGRMFVIDAFGSNQVLLDKFYLKIKEYYNKYSSKIKTVVIEAISAFQYAYDSYRDRNRINADGIPFESVKAHSESKNTRLQMILEPAFRSDKLLLPNDPIIKKIVNNYYVNKGLMDLEEELRFFDIKNKNNNDDMIDALALAVAKVYEIENIMSYNPKFHTLDTKKSRKEKYKY